MHFILIYMRFRCIDMRFRFIYMRFSMNSLPDSCWALRVSDEFSAWFAYRARPGPGPGPGPGPQLWTADLKKTRPGKNWQAIHQKKSMFEQISTISTISMIPSPDECSPKCPSPYIYTHPHWIAIPAPRCGGLSMYYTTHHFGLLKSFKYF